MGLGLLSESGDCVRPQGFEEARQLWLVPSDYDVSSLYKVQGLDPNECPLPMRLRTLTLGSWQGSEYSNTPRSAERVAAPLHASSPAEP
jgi:hypothetical protein